MCKTVHPELPAEEEYPVLRSLFSAIIDIG